MPVKQWDIPETVATVWSVDRNGDQGYNNDCVAGIGLRARGRLQIDLRNLRPLRLNDRESLIVELDVDEVLSAIAHGIRVAVKED